jgi:thymidylate synthase
MKELFVRGENLPEAYHNALVALHDEGEIVDCADWNTTCKEASMTFVVEHPLAEPMISKCFIGGTIELQQYMMEMLDGILDFEIERGNWEYTYHDRMTNYNGGIDQLSFVVEELKRNPSSRRASVLVRDARDIGSEDPACLQHMQFFIRDGKLDCIVLFRSNDAAKASYMNAFALIMIQKRIADKLGVEVGQYVHRANSYHCYERDFDSLERYVKRIKSDPESCVSDYEDDWKDMMDEAIPEIMAKVEELKNR